MPLPCIGYISVEEGETPTHSTRLPIQRQVLSAPSVYLTVPSSSSNMVRLEL